MLKLPPLRLYVHIPWCLKKCHYCDFNSHIFKSNLPEQEYVTHLLTDLETDLNWISGRQIHSIFIGGGTPSLLSSKVIQFLLDGIRQKVSVSSNAEITIEANPRAIEVNRFKQYQKAGINRISIGLQSLMSINSIN